MALRRSDLTADFKYSFEIDPDQVALLVIDMQNASACRSKGIGKVIAEQGSNDAAEWRFSRIENVVLPNLTNLLTFFRENSLPIIHVAIGSEMDDYSDMPLFLRPLAKAAGNRVGSEANDFLPDARPHPGERVIRKTTQSAFMSSSIDAVLRAMEVKELLLTGVSTNACVDGTARDAADLSYHAVIIEDACAGTSEELHLSALRSFANQAGLVMSTNEVIDELADKLHEQRTRARISEKEN